MSDKAEVTMEYQVVMDEEGDIKGFQPIIHIHVPEQPPPVIHVHVPEQGPPQVTVEAKTEPVIEVRPDITVPPAAVNVQPAKGKRVVKFRTDKDGNPTSAEIDDA